MIYSRLKSGTVAVRDNDGTEKLASAVNHSSKALLLPKQNPHIIDEINISSLTLNVPKARDIHSMCIWKNMLFFTCLYLL